MIIETYIMYHLSSSLMLIVSLILIVYVVVGLCSDLFELYAIKRWAFKPHPWSFVIDNDYIIIMRHS